MQFERLSFRTHSTALKAGFDAESISSESGLLLEFIPHRDAGQE